MKCCGACWQHPCPAEQKHLKGSGSGLICWLLLFWCLIVTAGAMFVLPARADNWKAIQQAAWDAYEFKDGQYKDCDVHAREVHARLKSHGISSLYDICRRNGEGHVYLMLPGGMAIDNSSPYPMSLAEVGCGPVNPL